MSSVVAVVVAVDLYSTLPLTMKWLFVAGNLLTSPVFSTFFCLRNLALWWGYLNYRILLPSACNACKA
jgi:hypothetical protein